MTHLRRDNQECLAHLLSDDFDPTYNIHAVLDAAEATRFVFASNTVLNAIYKDQELVSATLRTWGFDSEENHQLTDDELAIVAPKLGVRPDTPAPGKIPELVNITLNSFDAEGNQVDTDNMDLTAEQASDIIDHAAQLVVVMRDMVAKRSGPEAFSQVYGEMEEALASAGVLDTDDNPMLPDHFLQ